MIALFTDDYARRFEPGENWTAEETRALLAEQPISREEAEQEQVLAVSDMVTLADGRIAMCVTSRVLDHEDRIDIVVLSQVDDHWLVDNVIPLGATAAGTPEVGNLQKELGCL